MYYLAEGKENAKSGNELRNLLGLKNYREVTMLIFQARNEGKIICSSTHGYYLPQNQEEVKAFSRGMHHRIKEMKKSVKPADDLLLKEGAANG